MNEVSENPYQYEEVLFKEEQSFVPWVKWLLASILCLFAVLPGVIIYESVIVENRPLMNEDTIISSIAVIILLPFFAMLAFTRMRTKVVKDAIIFRLWFLKRRYPIENISEYEAITLKSSFDVGGYGIKYNYNYGWAYVIGGIDCVRLKFGNGAIRTISSTNNQAFAMAIKKAKELNEPH
ncbi:MAG: hypothetical protein NUW37_12350 [Planctomycetes bacterium]|nr:hypothetical protein [Planctomycetota bacterium]